MDPKRYSVIAGRPCDIAIVIGLSQEHVPCHKRYLSKCTTLKMIIKELDELEIRPFPTSRISSMKDVNSTSKQSKDNKTHEKDDNKKAYELQRGYNAQQILNLEDQSAQELKNRAWTDDGVILPTIRLPYEDHKIFIRLTHFLYTGRYPLTSDDPEAAYIHPQLFNMCIKFDLPALADKALLHANLCMFIHRNRSDIEVEFDFLSWENQVKYLKIVWYDDDDKIHDDWPKLTAKENGLKSLVIRSVLNDEVHIDIENVAVKVPEFHKDLTMALMEDRKHLLEAGGTSSSTESDEYEDGTIDSETDVMDMDMKAIGFQRAVDRNVKARHDTPMPRLVRRKLDFSK